MTKDEIGKLYYKANGWNPIIFEITMQELDRFTALVIAHEREACARVCEDNADDLSEGDWDSACLNCAEHIRSRGT